MKMKRNTLIASALLVLMMAPICATLVINEEQQRVESAAAEVLAISDKPMPAALDAADEGQEVEDELAYQEAAEEYPEYVYYAPVYSNTYWYESDDAEAEAEAKEWIAWRESGGDYDARNGQYVGRYQLNEMYLDGDYSEENQEAAAEAYIADRYGSWQAAQEHWREYGWY